MRNTIFNTDMSSLRRIFTEKSNDNSLTTLISKKKWEKVIEVLTSEDKDDSYFSCRYKCNKKCEHGHCLLHLALRLHPPFYIIKAMLEAFPDGPSETDCMKRYPLHIAAKYGISVRSMKVLLTANPKAAGALDLNGQTPLHLVFHEYNWKTQSQVEFGREFSRATLGICELLCRAAPKSVLIEVDGVSVIESALVEDADLRVVRVLQRITEDVQKESIIEVNSALVEQQVLQAMKDEKFLLKNKESNASLGSRRVSIMLPEMKQYNSKTA